MDAFEARGQWWLPEKIDRKVPGTLVVDNDGRAELRLVGAMRPWRESGDTTVINPSQTATSFSSESMARAGTYPRIVGVARGKAYTLESCFRVRLHNLLTLESDGQEEDIQVQQVFRNVMFDPGEALQFETLIVRQNWLLYWVKNGGISGSAVFKGENQDTELTEYNIKVQTVEDQVFQGSGPNLTITLGHRYNSHGDGVLERGVKQDFYFAIESPGGLLGLTELLAEARLLQDLVSIGTGKTSGWTDVRLRHPDVTQRISEDRSLPRDIELFAQWSLKSEVDEKSRKAAFVNVFDLGDIGSVSKLTDWLIAVTPYRSQLARVMATRYSERPYATDQFMACAAAIEGYDRDKHKDQGQTHYVDRVKRCCQLAGEPFGYLVDGKISEWALAVKGARNDVAHHNPGIAGASLGQYVLGKSAYWLFVLCMLRESSMPDAVFDRIRESMDFEHARNRVSDLLNS